MSFARAQRFNYKKPDVEVSPADYNVPLSSFDKAVSIPKCGRFHDKMEREETNVCKRTTCCGRNQGKSDCHHSDSNNTSRDERICYRSDSNLSRNDFKRSSFRRNSIMKKSSTPKLEAKKGKSKRVAGSFDPLPKGGQYPEYEFVDDDYHSFTSSEELDGLKKIQEYEFNEVCTAYSVMMEKQKNPNFENVLLRKLNNIEQSMEKFNLHLAEVTRKTQVDQLVQHHEKERHKIENVRKYCQKELVHMSHSKYQEILDLIANSLNNLNADFEHKRRNILKRSERKILELIDDIYDISNSSAREIKHLFNETALTLSTHLTNVVGTDLNLAQHCDKLLEKFQETFSDNHECFNYENICKLLSDKLQVTQDELEALEEDNLDITLKYHDTQQALETQTSLIEDLHSEIDKLKKSMNDSQETQF